MNLWIVMETPFIALTLVLITTVQGVSSCTNGDVELIQDPDDTRIFGYVQYCFRGEWGRVCRWNRHITLWDDSEATVACRQLGYYNRSIGYAYVSHDSTWTGGFVSLNCMNGMENSLEDCDPYRVITDRENTCKSGNQARLLCEPADCTDGTIRLVGGSTGREGRVEVCVGGRWGTVQTNQSLEVAQTVCRSQSQSLSFYSTSSCYVARFGYSLSKPVYKCSLNTNGGLECLNSTTPDDHTRDLGVSCESEQHVLTCSDLQSGQFRLVDGRSHNEGRLEVCVGCQWRGVSTTSLSNTTTGEICTRLGFSGEPTVKSFEPTGGDVYCCNTELHCTQCNNCNQTMSVALLKCRTYQETTDSEMFSSQYSTTMPPTTMIPITPPSSGTTTSTTETTTAQHNQSTAAESPRPDDGGSIAAVIVVLVLAMATGCIIICAVVVWKRITARKNSIKLSTAGPDYEDVTTNQPKIDTYDVIGHNQPRLSEAQVANQPPVRDEAIENQDDFHNAEQHLYAVVNKKAKKRSSPDESPCHKTFDTIAMFEGGEI
ncbi:neurotrypsin-like isoform X2 [Halichondria panicea]|uniref:neurotrypsin-like isoform X2 n=1 Tax=Halichondria panicea TaxID=6063 RepID=UPI00312B49F5